MNNTVIKSVIKLEWQGMPSVGGAAYPAVFDRNKHRRIKFFDLDIRDVYTTTMVEFELYDKKNYLSKCTFSLHQFKL